MPVSIIKTRNMYEGYLKIGSNSGAARQAFQNEFRHRLGLCDKAGNDYRDRVGNRILRECDDEQLRLNSDDFSIKELMESIVGHGVSSFLASAEDFVGWRNSNYAIEQRFPGDPRALLEAPGVGVGPSAFADINAWTAANSGLLERRVLEQFQNPGLIGDIICPPEQTRIAEGQKIIGVANLSQLPTQRQPGMPHTRATMQERYITLPRTIDWAMGIDVTFEAAWFDLTGQVLETAEQVGKRCALAREYRQIDAVIGVSTSTGASTGICAFNYKGTAYQQFNAAALAGAYPANTQSNPISGGDWQTIKAAWLLLKRMLDPENSQRIEVNADTILCGLEAAITAGLICSADGTQRRTTQIPGTGASTQATAPTLTVQNSSSNPASFGGVLGVKRVLTSALLEQRMLDTTGLNLSAANVANYFWVLEAGKSHRLMTNIPLEVKQVAMASSYEMLDRKILQSTFVSTRDTPSVWSPWHIVQNTN